MCFCAYIHSYNIIIAILFNSSRKSINIVAGPEILDPTFPDMAEAKMLMFFMISAAHCGYHDNVIVKTTYSRYM